MDMLMSCNAPTLLAHPYYLLLESAKKLTFHLNFWVMGIMFPIPKTSVGLVDVVSFVFDKEHLRF